MLGVGIVGAAPSGGWGGRVHVPALKSLPGVRLVGVANRSPESGQAAARELGIPRAFAGVDELATDPEVDVVAVCTRVSAHAEGVRAAIAAGKHVFCEWPLGIDSAETAALAGLARERGVRHAIGLQARCSPAFLQARKLLAEGFVGKVHSATLYSSLHGRGPVLDQRLVYTLDPANGATNLQTGAGHTLDILEFVLGDCFESLSAILSNQQPEVTVRQTGEVIGSTSANHDLVIGRLRGGAVAAGHSHASKRNQAHTWLEVAGSDGDLRLESVGGSREPGVQGREFRLLGAHGHGQELGEIPVDAGFRWVPAEVPGEPVLNVAQLYARFAETISGGAEAVPDFDDAVHLYRLLDAVGKADRTGTIQRVD